MGDTHRVVRVARVGLFFSSGDLELSDWELSDLELSDSELSVDSLSVLVIAGAVEYVSAWMFSNYTLQDMEEASYMVL